MNLNFSVKEICEILDEPVLSEVEDHKIDNVIIDSRNPRITDRSLFIALPGVKDDGHHYLNEFAEKGGKVAIVQKEYPSAELLLIQVQDALQALQKLAQAHRKQFDYPVIGITGSNGKTIVKEWLYHVLRYDFNIVRSPKSYNSQIGVPLSLFEMTAHHNLGIFEAGISQPGEMVALYEMIQPTIGVFTGIGDAHAENFESDADKKKEKFKLFQEVEHLVSADEIERLDLHLTFRDKASILNANLVYHTAKYLGVAEDRIQDKMLSLPAVSMRLEQLQGVNGCLLINDAYTADIAALEIALSHLNQVAGDRDKVLILSLTRDQWYLTEGDAFSDIIGSVDLNKIIFIGEENVLLRAGVDCDYYPSTEAYINRADEFENTVILLKGSRRNNLERIVHHFAEKKHITQLEISLSAMRNNLNVFRNSIEEGVKTLVMVKAQSYGTGLVEIAQFLQGESVDYLGVAYADEGVALRKAGIDLPILVMNPEKNAFDDIVTHDLEPSIYSGQMLQSFLHFLILKQMEGYPIHIKLDTGMNRLGFVEEELKELLDTINTQPEVFVKSVFSHLAVADDSHEREFTYEQIRRFEFMTGELMRGLSYSFDRHLANSSGILNYPSAHYNMVRVGIGLYGLMDESKKNLEHVLTLTSEISQIKVMKEGESLGYGRAFIADAPTTVAVVPVGYADGLRRGLSKGNWHLIINGKKAKVLGNICMDMCMVDITDIQATVGDSVQIFGKENSVFEMARHLYTIPYEVISSISSRVHRVYLD